jgi:hypothetical protein
VGTKYHLNLRERELEVLVNGVERQKSASSGVRLKKRV